MRKFFQDTPRNWAVFAVPAALAGLACSLMRGAGWTPAAVTSVLSGMTAFATVFFINRHDTRLAARMKGEASFEWNVRLNGVGIGRIKDAQYAEFQRAAFRDGRLAVAQSFNACNVAMKVAGRIFVDAPLILFWLLVVAWIAEPQSIMSLIEAAKSGDVEVLTASFGTLSRIVGLVAVLSLGSMLAAGYRFGFHNFYDQEVDRMIRQHCNTPAQGEIRLSKVDAPVDVLEPGPERL